MATRGDEGDWDPIAASWEVYEGIGPGGIAKQLKITRRSSIGPRAPLLAYVDVDAEDIAKVLQEFADHPEPSDRTHITETVRFLDDLDKRAVMGWLQTQARSSERRNEMAEALMFGDLDKDDLISEAIELTWPGVPVTACASIRPLRSKTPAERSPHSRTMELKAVRISACACSSTTEIRRFHMICMRIRESAPDLPVP